MKYSLAIVLMLTSLVALLGCGGSGGTTTTTTTQAGTTTTTTSTTTTTLAFQVASTDFTDGGPIPDYCLASYIGGNNDSIELHWSNIPSSAKSLAFAFIDTPPIANNFVHWLVINIATTESSLPTDASGTLGMKTASELNNSDGSSGYIGPYPPSGAVHNYVVTMYALNVASLSLGQTATLGAFNSAISGKILAQATYTGTYETP